MHVAAFSGCAIAAEHYMRTSADPEEIAMCVAEDNVSRRAIKAMYGMLSDPRISAANLPAMMTDHLPIGRVMDTVHFAGKREALILCIADICAYITKRYLAKAKYGQELYGIMTNNAGPSLNDLDRDLGWYLLAPAGG